MIRLEVSQLSYSGSRAIYVARIKGHVIRTRLVGPSPGPTLRAAPSFFAFFIVPCMTG